MTPLISSIVRAMVNSLMGVPRRRCISSPSRRPWRSSLMMAASSGVLPSGRVAFSLCWRWGGVMVMTARISAGLVAGNAPCLRRLLQPCESGLVMLPGTAKTSLPCSSAWAAVLSVPLRSAASVITTTSARPATRRLRSRKLQLPKR